MIWKRHFLLIVAVLVVYLLIMSAIVSSLEGWSFGDSVYFSTVTVSTIGYGDLVPTKNGTKVLVAVTSFAGVGLFFYMITLLSYRESVSLEEKTKGHKKYKQ